MLRGGLKNTDSTLLAVIAGRAFLKKNNKLNMYGKIILDRPSGAEIREKKSVVSLSFSDREFRVSDVGDGLFAITIENLTPEDDSRTPKRSFTLTTKSLHGLMATIHIWFKLSGRDASAEMEALLNELQPETVVGYSDNLNGDNLWK